MNALRLLVLIPLVCLGVARAEEPHKVVSGIPANARARVICALGDTLHVTRLGSGLIIAGNQRARHDISAWKLADSLEGAVSDYLNAWNLAAEPFPDPAARAALTDANNYSNVAIFQVPKLRKAVKEVGARSGADVLVVINGFSPTHQHFIGYGQSLPKFGIAEYGDPGRRDSIYFVQFTLVFYDARSGKMLGYGYFFDSVPRTELPEDLAMSAEELESARQQLDALLRRAALTVLRQIAS